MSPDELEPSGPAGAASVGRRRVLELLLGLPGAACPSAWARAVSPRLLRNIGDFVPEVLSGHEYDLVTVVSEIMIPTTDTPGAIVAGVNRFIDRMLAHWNTPEERKHFLAELQKLDTTAQALFHKQFLDLSPAEQTDVLRRLEKDGIGTAAGMPMVSPKPLFTLIKEYVVIGYYTSAPGGSQELAWIPIPGFYSGCITDGSGRRSVAPY